MPARRCSKCDLAWASGFFEGEGSVSRAGRGRDYFQLEVTQKDPESLERFLEVVKLGRIYGPYQYGKSQPFYKFAAHGADASKVFSLLEPWLSSRRINQAKEMQSACKTV